MTEPIYNTDFYYVRTDINEFLREHPFVSDLYDATLQCLFGLGESKEQALHVFNQAYYICTLIVEKGGDKHDILRLINDDDFEKDGDDYTFTGLILTVVKCLLRVHQELVQFDSNIIKWLGDVISVGIDSSQFNHVVANYAGDFEKALNFSGKMVEVPIEEKNECEEPSVLIDTAQSLIFDAREKLLIRSEKQEERIVELEEQLRLEREKNCVLALQLKAMEKPEETGRATVHSGNAISDAINVNSIGDYACGLSNEDHATVISTMLSKLSNRAYLERDDMQVVNRVIEQIDNAHKPEPTRHIHCEKYVEKEINNDNKDSQVFNGNIENSQFGK